MGVIRTTATPSFLGVPMKHVSLGILMLQSSVLILTMHHSRVMPVPDGKRYLTSTAILLAELIKLAISLSASCYTLTQSLPTTSLYKLLPTLFWQIFSSESWKLAVPAVMYTLQNALLFTATSNLTAATFQVTYQVKILTTVLFSVMLLGKRPTSRQWIALVLLTVGVAVVQIPESQSWSISSLFSSEAALSRRAENDGVRAVVLKMASQEGNPVMSTSRGLMAVMGAATISGLTGVYLEKVVKSHSSPVTPISPTFSTATPSSGPVSIWIRNAQLSFFSLFPAVILGVWYQDGSDISESGFFVGYNSVVWATILLQAVGGLMVAVCLLYADNITKNFAASFSIIFSATIGAVFLGSSINSSFLFGTSIVVLAIYLHSTGSRSTSPIILPIIEPPSKKGPLVYIHETHDSCDLDKR